MTAPKGRKQDQGINRVHIRPLIEGWHKERLEAEAEKAGVTMNLMLRKILTERYSG